MENYLSYKDSFDALMGVKTAPNTHEQALLLRAAKYIEKITWIPGLRMVAVVNSLSMYATHDDSDIDLFIITAKNRIWIARTLITAVFYCHGVWRHGADIAGNFCLSFFVEDDALDMGEFAIEHDIYLFFWLYYLRPIAFDDTILQEFSRMNELENTFETMHLPHISIRQGMPRILNTPLDILNGIIRFFGEKKSRQSWRKKGSPEGVVIAHNILKFHDRDRRIEIREKLIDKI